MAVTQHRAMESMELLEAIQLCLDAASPQSLVLVCASQVAFEATFMRLIAQSNHHQLSHLLHEPPSLRTLAASGRLKLAFCSGVAACRAAVSQLVAEHASMSYSRLIVINMLAMHRSTPSWTAQGLNRSLAAAIDFAEILKCQLLLVEDPALPVTKPNDGLSSSPAPESGQDEAADQPVWDEDIGLVDARLKAYGSGGRGWAGRTVKVRQVVQRWLVFDGQQPG